MRPAWQRGSPAQGVVRRGVTGVQWATVCDSATGLPEGRVRALLPRVWSRQGRWPARARRGEPIQTP
jgi:hypothetical protein